MIRKASEAHLDPACPDLSALSDRQKKLAQPAQDFVREVPAQIIMDILHRVLSYNGDDERKVRQSAFN